MLTAPNTLAAPAAFTVRLLAPFLGVDLSTVTAVSGTLKRADETIYNMIGWTIVSQSPTELVAQYELSSDSAEFTGTGTYYIALLVQVPGGGIPAQTVTLFVTDQYGLNPKLEDDGYLVATARINGQKAGGFYSSVVTSNGTYSLTTADGFNAWLGASWVLGPAIPLVNSRVTFKPPPGGVTFTSGLTAYPIEDPNSTGSFSATQHFTGAASFFWNGTAYVLDA